MMTHYFYFDGNGQKQGPVDERQLRDLAARGIITPNTPTETDTGYSGVAGVIPGLFTVPPLISQPAQGAPPPMAPPPPYTPGQGTSSNGSGIGVAIGITVVLVLVVVGICLMHFGRDAGNRGMYDQSSYQTSYQRDFQDVEKENELREMQEAHAALERETSEREARARAARAEYEAHGRKTDYAEGFREGANEALKDLSNDLFKIVEFAHGTVTCKKGTVTSCIVETIDGSDFVGPEGSNVSTVRFAITIVWDGQIHKDGYTVMEFDYDVQNEVMLSGKLTKTNAMVNVLDPDWWEDLGELFNSL